MDGKTAGAESEKSAAGVWRDLGLIVILLLLATGIRAWLVSHTEVAARDSIGFIRSAVELEQKPWPEVLRASQQHPGYPVLLLGVSQPVRHFLGGTNAFTMQLIAQLTSSLCGVLVVIPLFFLGKELFSRGVGFWASALFQCLPVSGRVMADALSEATFLLFAAAALMLAVWALRRNSVLAFTLCGLFAGLAYLTRPEGLLIAVAAAGVLLATFVIPAWRRPWQPTLACTASLLFAFLAAAAPFMAVIGHVTIKPTGVKILEAVVLEEEQEVPQHADPGDVSLRLPEAQRGPVTFPLAVWLTERERSNPILRFREIGAELIQCFNYVAWLPALLGLWWYRDRLRAAPDAWPILLLCVMHALLLWRLARIMGYVSERHLLLLVMCGVFWAVAGVYGIGYRLSAISYRPEKPGTGFFRGPKANRRKPITALLLLALVVSGLPKTLKPLHANRAGHHAAGLWLAEHTQPADPILDPFCWAHYYAGRVFWEGREPPRPEGYRPTLYVVVEPADRAHPRLPLNEQALRAASQGQVVYHWPAQLPVDKAKVLVHAVPLPDPKGP